MKVTVKQLKALIREAAEEAMEEGRYSGEHGEWTPPDDDDDRSSSYSSRSSSRSSRDYDRDEPHGKLGHHYTPDGVNPYTEALAEAFRAGYRRGLKVRRR